MLIAEHCLNIKHKVSFNGYNFIAQFRTVGKGGGTAVCVKDCYKYAKISTVSNSIENVGVELDLVGGEKIAFLAMYKTPLQKLVGDDLTKILNAISANQIVLGGDLNARNPRWGTPS